MFTLLDFINAKMIIGRRIRIQIKGVNNDIVFDFFSKVFLSRMDIESYR